ncbi:DUF2515 family protein [Pseudobacillus wudalianchiensis]|uniref:DUF2515 family protein n=1 Tax=Pseudobacillus wudalianchiensis TaxID=1743143 RepID=UPI001FDF6765|nr:DUF2515 family protein [Bacillus wudalianchiensis]
MEKLRKKQSLPSHLYGIQEGVKKRLQAVPMLGEMSLPKKGQDLLQKIRLETARLNVNKVVRTKAYLDFYRLYPEIRWAFLAHMISRNGGWNMTDLRSDLHSCFFNEEKRQVIFLERSNRLIFQDAYPQFLEFMESKRQNQTMFYLLPF